MNGPFRKPERSRYRRPTWPALPRVRRLRVDGPHGPASPHPMMLAALVRSRLRSPLWGAGASLWTNAVETAPGLVLDRVA
ncbi:MAG TPA: hypothetical protein VKA46_10690 [Gemmataceae bacterium]|nr:hypothetical protein [Gemmataceae bacterium]